MNQSIGSIATLSVLSFRNDIVDFCKNACISLFSTNVIPILDDLSELNATIVVIDSAFLQIALPLYQTSLEYNSKRVICFLPLDSSEEIRRYAEEKYRFILPFPVNQDLFLDCCRHIKDENICRFNPSGFKQLSRERFLGLPDSVFGFFSGNSDSIREVRTRIFNYAQSTSPVLLLGETGTGKSSAAKLIHQLSPRCNFPFKPINASWVVDTLAVSSFFGVDNGAYTDAVYQKGVIKSADGGSLFVDEVGSSSMNFQAMLLSVIENGIVQSLGSDKSETVDVRFIFATNANLYEMMEYGSFRPDLYHRISANVIYFPPIRERREDIPVIAENIADEFNVKLSGNAVECLCEYRWPGNIRELRQCIKRAAEQFSFLNENEIIIDADALEFGYL